MSSLENKKIKDTYKDLLQVSNENNGIDDTLRTISDGEGTASSLKLSSTNASFSGNVGIGTSELGTKLTIQQTNAGVLSQYRVGSNYVGQILGDQDGIFGINGRTGIDFSISGNETSALKIDLNGNVGIGTTSPDVKLDVNVAAAGKFAFRAINTTSTGHGAFIKGGGGAQQSRLHVEGSENNDNPFIITGEGKVGIGRANPVTLLDLNAPKNDSDGNPLNKDVLISFSKGETGEARIGLAGMTSQVLAGALTNDLCIRSDGNNIKFGTASATRTDMTIDSDGKVGIGTTSPYETLTVNGFIGRGAHYNGALTGGYNAGSLGTTNVSSMPIFVLGPDYRPTSTSLDNMYGIGYTEASASFIENSNGWGMYVASDGDARIWLGASGGSSSYFNAGNVGIGDTNPSKKLSVAGDAIITGDLTVSGTTITTDQETIMVRDKNIILGNIASPNNPDDDTANGGGIVLKGASDKSILYNAQTSSWNSNLPITINGQTLATQSWVSDNAFSSLTDAQKAELKGDQGDQGESGADGADGADGAKGDQGDSYFTQNGNDISYTDGHIKLQRTDNINSQIHFANNTDEMWSITGDADGDFSLERRIKETGAFSNRIITIEKGSTEALRIDSDGNVGIGTDGPETKLHIKGAQPVIRLEDTNTNLYSEIYADTGAGDLLFIADKSAGGTDPMMSFRIGGTALANEKMRIKSNGNIGIGTNDPVFKLDVSAEKSNSYISRIWNTSTELEASGLQVRCSGGADGHSFAVYSDDAYQFAIKNNGNVGIGTTNPSGPLEIHTWGDKMPGTVRCESGNSTCATTQDLTGYLSVGDVVRLANDNYTSDSSNKEFTLAGVDANSITIEGVVSFTATLVIFRKRQTFVAKSGSIGVGDWSSKAMDATFNIRSSVDSENSTYQQALWIVNKAGDKSLMNVFNNGDVQMSKFKYDDENVRVGVGTLTPSASLHLKNTNPLTEDGGQPQDKVGIHFSSYDSIANASIKHVREDKKDRLEFSCGIDGFDFAQMSLNNDGNVGIGTNDPSYKLVVNSSGGSLSVNDNGHLVSKQNLDVKTAGGRLIGESEVGMLGDVMIEQANTGRKGGYIRFRTSDDDSTITEKMRITSEGNVGIGTDDPGANLHLSNSTGSTWLKMTSDKGTWSLGSASEGTPATKYFSIYDHDTNDHRLFIKENGNVGIGDTNPSKKLSVAGDAIITGDLTVSGTTITKDQETLLVQNKNIIMGSIASGTPTDDTANGGGIIVKASSDKSILFNKTTNKFDVNIGATFDGNVGIGTTSPDARLNVAYSSGDTNAGLFQETIRVRGDWTSVGSGPAITFTNYHSGANGANPDQDDYNLAAIQACDFDGKWGGGLKFFVTPRSDTTGGTHGGTSLAHAMTINSAGSVGIGTTSPSAKLVIQEDSVVNTLTEAVSFLGGNYTSASNAESFKFFHKTNASNTNRGVAFKSIDGSLQIQTIVTSSNASTANNISLQPSDGNVGIGTISPDQKLEIFNGALKFGTSRAGLNEFEIFPTDEGSNGLGFYDRTNTAYRMLISNDGNVGIGTTEPSDNLDIIAGSNRFGISITNANNPARVTLVNNEGTALIDTNNGLLRLGNSTSEDLVINSDGNVGIGTTSPSDFDSEANHFVIQGNNHTGMTICAGNDQSRSNIYFADGSNGTENYSGGITYDHKDDNLSLRAGSKEAMWISSNGNVGIGTDDPKTQFHIKSAQPVVRLEDTNTNLYSEVSSDSGKGDLLLMANASGGGTDPMMSFRIGGTAQSNEKMRILSNGNIGIGTMSPNNQLTIGTDNDKSSTIGFRTTQFASIAEITAEHVSGTSADGRLHFKTRKTGDSLPRLTIHESGNVGIGTDDPDELLHIANTSGGASLLIETNNSSGGNVLFGDDTSNTVGRIQYLHSDNSMRFSTSGSNSPSMLIDSAGNVGIGTDDPGKPLELRIADDTAYAGDVAGNAFRIRNTSQAPNTFSCIEMYAGQTSAGGVNVSRIYAIKESATSTATSLTFATRASNETMGEAMRITSAGNVGIGTTRPIGRLSIEGSTASDYKTHIVFNNTGGSKDYAIGAGIHGSTNEGFGVVDRNTNDPLLYINSAGNVGIGTRSPGAKLEIKNGGSGVWFSTNNLSSRADLTRAGQNYINLTDQLPTDENSFEIGPGYINLNRDDDVPVNQLSFGMNGTLGAAIEVGGGTPSSPNNQHSLRFKVGRDNLDNKAGIERMRIDSNGNVGIGTTSPEASLDFGTKSGKKILLWKSNIGVNDTVKIRYGLGVEDLDLQIFTEEDAKMSFGRMARSDGETFSPDMTINSAGNVGIGNTSPGTYKLNVTGNIYANGNVNSSSTILTSDDRIKHNEQPIKNALDTLSKITPKKYIKTTDLYEANHDFALNAENKPIDENGKEIEHTIEAGVIAQELKNINELAFAVNDEQKDEEGNVIGPHAVNYNSLFTYAISAINELNEKVNDLKSELASVNQKINKL